MDKERVSRLIDAAMGRIPYDLVIRNAEVVDVCSRSTFRSVMQADATSSRVSSTPTAI